MSVLVGITQRVVENDSYKERRDVLAQDWAPFLKAVNVAYVPLPNTLESTQKLFMELPFKGFILSGGNDLGSTPDRDAVEAAVLNNSIDKKIPVIGVCRGMQMMHHHLGGVLENIEGHVQTRHKISYKGQNIEVNSYHDQGFKTPAAGLNTLSQNEDGVIEAIQHQTHNWHGIMWHPEREAIPAAHDIALFKEIFTS